VLDGELDDVLIVFDETVLEARRKALENPSAPGSQPSADVDISGEQGGGGGGGAGEPSVAVVEGGEQDPADGGGEDYPQEGEEGDSEPGADGIPSGNSPTDDISVAGAAPPNDIPDGQDDDIVARQLRELATAEKDPELRAKYWEEYKRYKEGSGN
jgi:hypothetical protein|tara:strand:- start:4467 stop:4934 length:468 start_codon:yes stop_codon:yes gene_type:complete